MESTALCFRLLIIECILLESQAQNRYTESDEVFLRITPDRLQHFEYEPVTFHCEGTNGSTRLRVIRNKEEFKPVCEIKRTPTGSSCTIDKIYPGDGGEYWCEIDGGERSNTANITVTGGSVILESPVLSVKEGDPATLRCRKKETSSDLKADFYKDGLLIRNSSSVEMTIYSVTKADEGLYKCRISGAGESPESRLTMINNIFMKQNEEAGSVILETPAHPVMEGDAVILHCRNKVSSTYLPAVFYKDGLFIGSSSTGHMTIHHVYKSHEGLYKCNISGAGESPERWLAVRAGSVILESPVLPVMEGEAVTLSCRNKILSTNITADFYKNGFLMGSSSTGNMTIHYVYKSHEGLYKCIISGAGESPESWLAVRALHGETCPCPNQFFLLLLLLRTVFTIVMVPLLLLLVGLLHCGKLRVAQK